MIKTAATLFVVYLCAFPVLAEDNHVKANEAMRAGDMESALEAYMDILIEAPDDLEALETVVILAGELGIPELAVEFLLADVDRSIETGQSMRLQRNLRDLGEIASAHPPWVEARLASAFDITEEQIGEFEAWEELSTDAQALLDAGDYETAMAILEGAFFLAQDSFGQAHWTTIASARDFGFAAANLGDVETADAFFNEALSASMEALGEAHPNTQYIAELLAELYSKSGATEGAVAIRDVIIGNYEAEFGVGHLLTLEAIDNQISTYEYAGDYAGALELRGQLCDRYHASLSQYHPESINCDSALAFLHQTAGSLDEAQKVRLSISENLARSTQDLHSLALTNLMQLADIYRAQGDLQVSGDLLSGLITTARQLGDTEISYTSKNYLARVLTDLGQFNDAQILVEDVLHYGRTAWSDQPQDFYNVMLELGAIYQRQSKLAEAESMFEESLVGLLENFGELHPSTLVAMNNLGNIYEQIGLYDEAEPVLKQALSGWEQSLGVTHPQTARTRNNLALLYESQGNFREAEPLYNTSYEHIAAALGENHIQALGMQNNLAYLYMIMEKYDASAALFENLVERWTIAVGPEHQDALKSLNNLGRVYRRQDRFDEAEQVVLQALRLRRETLGTKHIDSIRSLIDIGAIHMDQGRLNEAEMELSDALKLAEEEIGEQHPYTFEALNNLAKLREAKGELSAAVELREVGLARRSTFLDRMLWVTGENAREGYIRVHRPELDAYLSLLTRVDDPLRGQKAIEASLQRKGLLLKVTSEIEQIAQLSTDPKLTSVSVALEQARKDLASLTLSGPTAETQGRHAEALYELELEVNELQGELGRASVRYRSSIAGASAQSVAAALGDNTALVDFLMYTDKGDKKVLAGVIVKEKGEIRYDLVEFSDRESLEAAVLEYRSIIQDDLADEDELLEMGQEAHELTWGPIVESIGDLEYVYLVPDGVLNILPFNALINDDEEYLIQTTDLHILTSGRDLLPNEYQLSQGEYVILAGPDYNSEKVVGEKELAVAAGRRSAALKLGVRGAGSGLRGLSFAPLPGAEEEGRVITDRVEANDQTNQVYFGEQAQEQVLADLTEAPEILHVATHGFFLEADDTLRKRLLKMQRSADIQVPPPGDNPLLRAGLAFAGINSNAQFLGDIDTANDGVLTALEVLGLNLSGTRLVVLSACETGLGEIHEGEGVYGLRRSFQEAGVAEVVSSLWEVSDAGTQALMTDFYDRILEGSPAREALRDTQLALIESPEWGYPYIWSAFMMVGSYESAGISVQ